MRVLFAIMLVGLAASGCSQARRLEPGATQGGEAWPMLADATSAQASGPALGDALEGAFALDDEASPSGSAHRAARAGEAAAKIALPPVLKAVDTPKCLGLAGQSALR